MADQNPMGGGRPVHLDLPEPQVKILQSTLTTCLLGVRSDLKAPHPVPDLARACREADAFERLLAGLDCGEVVIPDEAAREAVQAIATSVDQENNYTRVVAEHEALFGLLARLSAEEVKS